jgi:hypothetical protein
MPRTISTKPQYSIKFWKSRDLKPPARDVFDVLDDRLGFRYETPPPDLKGQAYNLDVRNLPRAKPRLPPRIKFVVASPPYMNVTNYEEDQWLRLWFLGGPEKPVRSRMSKDDRIQSDDRYWSMIGDTWRSLGIILADHSDIIIRLGAKGRSPEQLANCLHGMSVLSQRKVTLVSAEKTTIVKRQTDSFRPGAVGCSYEVDCHLHMK